MKPAPGGDRRAGHRRQLCRLAGGQPAPTSSCPNGRSCRANFPPASCAPWARGVQHVAVGDRVLTLAEQGGYAQRRWPRPPTASAFQTTCPSWKPPAWLRRTTRPGLRCAERGRAKSGETVLVLGCHRCGGHVRGAVGQGLWLESDRGHFERRQSGRGLPPPVPTRGSTCPKKTCASSIRGHLDMPDRWPGRRCIVSTRSVATHLRRRRSRHGLVRPPGDHRHA